VIKTNQDIENACYEGTVPVDEILDRTEADFLKLLQNRGVSDFVPVDVVVTNALKKIEDASRKHGTVTGISTGFIDLDTQTAGLQPSDLILLAARPSMGKTAFALNLAHHIAVHENQCVAIFSLEMSKEQLINRMFALQGHLDAQKLRSGQLEDAEWRELVDAAGVLSRSNLIIDDTPAISVSEMRSKCRKYKQEYGLSLIMIDYLQLMESSGSANVSQQQKIADISRSLKALARELNVPVIALSQLNRGVEQRDDKRPMMSDLRDSGAIEQDADVVMFIYRDDYYNHDSEKKGIAEVIIAKQRNGPIGTVDLAWMPEYTRFANLDRNSGEH
jgi:replicative DNA helicase